MLGLLFRQEPCKSNDVSLDLFLTYSSSTFVEMVLRPIGCHCGDRVDPVSCDVSDMYPDKRGLDGNKTSME